jgi:hypothetical protein
MYSVLLDILKDKAHYDRFVSYVKESVVPAEVYNLVKDMGVYFDKYSVSEIDWEDFIPWYKLTRASSLSKAKHEIIDKLFEQLDDVDESSRQRTIEMLIEKDAAMRMADHLLAVSEGDETKEVLDIDSMMSDFKKEIAFAADDDPAIKVDEDFFKDDAGDGLEWRLEELNISAGSLMKGNFVVVAAYVHTGKTTFLASEASYMAAQLPDDRPVLWLQNEEVGRVVLQKIQQAALGWTYADLVRSPIATLTALKKVWGEDAVNKIKLVEIQGQTPEKIEGLCEKYNPGLIIFDQLYNVEGFKKAFSDVDQQKQLFHWARQIAAKYAPVITTHQADGEAAGQLYPDLARMYNSRVSVQGAADLIITIGACSDGTKPPDTRGLFVAKNKLRAGKRRIEAERHGKYEVSIDGERGRYIGVY